MHNTISHRGAVVVVIIWIFTITCAISASSGEVYSIQHSMIKFDSDLQQVGRFFRVLPFPPPITLSATI